MRIPWHRLARPALPGMISLAACTLLAAPYTPLIELPPPRLGEHAVAYPGGSHNAANLLDGNPKSEYSSDAKGTNTFLVFEFPAPVRLGALRHVDRNDPATVAASELTVLDEQGRPAQRLAIAHVNQRGGETFFVLPAPVTAKKVRWQITRLGSQYSTVGGAEIRFYAAGEPEASPSRTTLSARALPLQRRSDQAQSVRLTVDYAYAESAPGVLRVPGAEPQPLELRPGRRTLDLWLPAVKAPVTEKVALEIAGQAAVRSEWHRDPVKPLTVYVLPHSHTDIGYTELQPRIEERQVNNLIDGMAHARRTASYPEGARFVWNVEVLWAADLYLRRMNDQQRADFLAAVKNGQVALCGMYLNELTGVCRPEELLRLFRMATQLSAQTGVPVDTAMISDVPGYTWGLVPAMNHAGIKYFSTAPNYFDRIGDILVQWENKPFYWLGPDGKSKVLVWIPFWGYAMSHRYREMTPQLVEDFCEGLEKRGYPYEVAYVRWSGHGDNAVPDPSICDFIKDWNEKHAWPRFVISSASEAFRALEQRHGRQIPVARGDWTPYWEDGVGSSALETALNRATSDQLARAETLFAMNQPGGYPAADFTDAWNLTLLYSEHTWGAWCSVNQPGHPETVGQWAIKQGYAQEAARAAESLHGRALAARGGEPVPNAVDVLNPLAWTRTDLVRLTPELSRAGNQVVDEAGQAVPSQRLADGSLMFEAREVPSLGARRYRVIVGAPAAPASPASISGAAIANGRVRARVDERHGGIVELTARGLKGNFADTTGGEALNDYLYFNGDDARQARRPEGVTIRPGEPGPLVASLVVESTAPGCRLLRREIVLAAGADHVECRNFLDKERLAVASYIAKEGKESVNFAFPFAVPGGELRLDLPLGVIRPHADLLPSACKNWFTVGRWADVSGGGRGITWVSLDAPLVQVGGLTANLLNSQSNPKAWRQTVEPTQKIYSWAMNNHWGTNYRAYQEGAAWFRFLLRPHGRHRDADASQFAVGASQPLIAVPARGATSRGGLLEVTPADVHLLSLKPSDDGRALIARLYGASGQARAATLRWGGFRPSAVHLSDTGEAPGAPVKGPVRVPGYGVVTLRLER